jgi:glycosyltransferase involved in cell wall biosynthesis
MTVAIIITSYNHAHFLDAAIRSALAQTVPPDEIIVVDDGSTDRPEEVTARFAGVRLIRQPNAGLAAARNTGWRAAASDHLVFLDADDRLLPDALRVNLARLAAAPEAGMAYGAYLNVDARLESARLVDFRPASDGFAAFLRANLIGMHATVMYRRERLAAIGGFEAGLPACEDYDVYLRMAQRFPVVFGPEPLAEYWHHGGNMSRNSGMMLQAALAVLGRQKAAAKKSGLMRAYRAGASAWKRYYVTVWCREMLRGARAGAIDPALIRQGALLAKLAPTTLLWTPFEGGRRAARWLLRRFRRAG